MASMEMGLQPFASKEVEFCGIDWRDSKLFFVYTPLWFAILSFVLLHFEQYAKLFQKFSHLIFQLKSYSISTWNLAKFGIRQNVFESSP